MVYTATDGSTVAVGSSVYDVDTTSIPGRVLLADGQTWPTPADNQHDAVRLTYVTGAATSSTGVPVNYKHAIKVQILDMYDNPDGDGGKLTDAARALLQPTRNMRFV